MSKYDPFETVEEKVQRHLVVGLLVVAGILAAVLTYLIYGRK